MIIGQISERNMNTNGIGLFSPATVKLFKVFYIHIYISAQF